MHSFPLISALTFTPLIGALVLVGLNAQHKGLARRLALGFSFISMLLAGGLWFGFDPASPETVRTKFPERVELDSAGD